MGTRVNRLPMPVAQWLYDRHIPFTVAGAALDFNQLPDYPLHRGTLGQCVFTGGMIRQICDVQQTLFNFYLTLIENQSLS